MERLKYLENFIDFDVQGLCDAANVIFIFTLLSDPSTLRNSKELISNGCTFWP